MKKYIVQIYEQPTEKEVEAEDKAEAEAKAMHWYNHTDYQDVYKVKVKRA